MSQNLLNETIVPLASILNVKHISNDVTQQALKVICNGFSFECGLIFEKGVTNCFCLGQHYGLPVNADENQFEINFLEPDEQAYLAQKLMTIIEKNEKNTPLELRLLDFHNAQSMVLTPIIDQNDVVYGFIILIDILHKKSRCGEDYNLVSTALSMLMRYIGISMYDKKLVQIQNTLESVLDHAGVDIYVNDFLNHDILYTNESMAAPYGGKGQFLGQKCWQVLFPGQKGPCDFCPQNNLIDENGMPTKVYSWDYQRGFDGSWFRVFSAAFHWVDGRLAHIVSSADITENKRNESLIENLANYDQLTQLPNRRSLIRECERRITEATENEQGYLLFFDIDGFKAINDNYGHDAGDEFLIQLGAFFSEIPLLKNSIYRNGGDEFVAILGGETISKDHIKHLSNFIHKRFENVWKLKNGEALCNISIGVACFPEDGRTSKELLQKADKAMYQVKKSGGGGFCFGYELVE